MRPKAALGPMICKTGFGGGAAKSSPAYYRQKGVVQQQLLAKRLDGAPALQLQTYNIVVFTVSSSGSVQRGLSA